MRSVTFILGFALICAAPCALAAPRILEVQGVEGQRQAQEPAKEPTQEKAQERPPEPDKAPVQDQPPPPPAATPEPPKKQTAEPAPAPAPQAPVLTQPARDEATNAPGRFSFRRVDGGILRLDSASGQIAICSSHDAGWACQAVPEERAALEKEIARLHGEVAGLKDKIAGLQKEIARLREPPPPRPPAELAPRSEDRGGLKLPSDEDIARARAAIVDAWQRLMDMIAKFQHDMTRKTTPPDRTTL